MKPTRRIAPALLTAAILAAPAATAEPTADRGAHGTIVAGVGVLPEYEGADATSAFPLVFGRVQWGRRYVALDGIVMRANLLDSDRFEFGPVASYTFGRDAGIESLPVAALGEIDDAVEAGLFFATSWNRGDRGAYQLTVQGVHDVSDVHDGWLVRLKGSHGRQLGGRFRLELDLSVGFAGDDYMETYFSVPSSFEAEGGVKDAALLTAFSYSLNRRWSLHGFALYQRLLGDAADSPIVAVEGNANPFGGGLGVGFSF